MAGPLTLIALMVLMLFTSTATCTASTAPANAVQMQLFGGDMMMSQEQIRKNFGDELADIAPSLYKLRDPDQFELAQINARQNAKDKTDSTERQLAAPTYENNRLWRYGRVFYSYDQASLGTEQVNLLRENMVAVAARFKNQCGISLIEREIPNVSVRIFDGDGCWSSIGAVGNAEMSLTGGCAAVDTASHEFLHLVDMFHMHSIKNRDNFVKINWDFITEGRENNFAEAWNTDSLNVKYDFESIMHYRQYTFTGRDANGQYLGPSIEILDPVLKAQYQDTMGNFLEISPKDAVQVQLMYHCALQETFTGIDVTVNGGVLNGARKMEELCDSECPCFEGQGHCNTDNDCHGNLYCHINHNTYSYRGQTLTLDDIDMPSLNVCLASPPTPQPTKIPTNSPSKIPTVQPSRSPNKSPSSSPTRQPTQQPSNNPTVQPSRSPNKSPSSSPTRQPTHQPSNNPTVQPSRSPNKSPSSSPTRQPTQQPSNDRSAIPTETPTAMRTDQPTRTPIKTATDHPSAMPTSTKVITISPTHKPTKTPTCYMYDLPCLESTKQPTSYPTTLEPTASPTAIPTHMPTESPTLRGGSIGTYKPSAKPTNPPTVRPSSTPTAMPTNVPSDSPSHTSPTLTPMFQPSTQPTMTSSTLAPMKAPSRSPSLFQSHGPTFQPSETPSEHPTTFLSSKFAPDPKCADGSKTEAFCCESTCGDSCWTEASCADVSELDKSSGCCPYNSATFDSRSCSEFSSPCTITAQFLRPDNEIRNGANENNDSGSSDVLIGVLAVSLIFGGVLFIKRDQVREVFAPRQFFPNHNANGPSGTSEIPVTDARGLFGGDDIPVMHMVAQKPRHMTLRRNSSDDSMLKVEDRFVPTTQTPVRVEEPESGTDLASKFLSILSQWATPAGTSTLPKSNLGPTNVPQSSDSVHSTAALLPNGGPHGPYTQNGSQNGPYTHNGSPNGPYSSSGNPAAGRSPAPSFAAPPTSGASKLFNKIRQTDKPPVFNSGEGGSLTTPSQQRTLFRKPSATSLNPSFDLSKKAQSPKTSHNLFGGIKRLSIGRLRPSDSSQSAVSETDTDPQRLNEFEDYSVMNGASLGQLETKSY